MVWIQRGDPGPKCGHVFVISIRFTVQTGWPEKGEAGERGVRRRGCAAPGGPLRQCCTFPLQRFTEQSLSVLLGILLIHLIQKHFVFLNVNRTWKIIVSYVLMRCCGSRCSETAESRGP